MSPFPLPFDPAVCGAVASAALAAPRMTEFRAALGAPAVASVAAPTPASTCRRGLHALAVLCSGPASPPRRDDANRR